MLISIGISVEFVAHPVAAYEFASGTREDRMLQAMSHTGLPVLEGALSSVLGFLFLAASDFDFVLKVPLRLTDARALTFVPISLSRPMAHTPSPAA